MLSSRFAYSRCRQAIGGGNVLCSQSYQEAS
jgi:hypothetical protein